MQLADVRTGTLPSNWRRTGGPN